MSTTLASYRHQYPFRVRTFHVDRQNVVHNIWYFFFLEEARVEYMRALGFPIDEQTFVSHTKFFVAHNSCNYRGPAFYNDELLIGSRVASVGTTSITFDHTIVKAATGEVVATASHVLVYVDADTNLPTPVPDDIRARIAAYEAGEVR
jgi:acyl-CoA thioester hydrolase